MSEETAAVAATPAAATPKKKAKSGAAKSKANPPTHPKVSEMVVKSITTLKERGGSSLQAIKKYISSEYKVDIDRLTPFIRKYLNGSKGTFICFESIMLSRKKSLSHSTNHLL
ncbi:Histone H1-III [Araneus ventricosus]|uniref:Histone H1-III n=1 Tax=Araneus ventricosus TaxID=182803 RepID=A0A4Y2VVQ6_ARAVE|nr:Histone H1-III [Araneus ventricosus]